MVKPIKGINSLAYLPDSIKLRNLEIWKGPRFAGAKQNPELKNLESRGGRESAAEKMELVGSCVEKRENFESTSRNIIQWHSCGHSTW